MDKDLICRLITSSPKIGINRKLSNYKTICDLFTKNKVRFHSFSSVLPEDLVEIFFTKNCKFQDVYLLAYLLKDFGIEIIYPLNGHDQSIIIGTNFHNSKSPKSLSITDFLKIDPKLSTEDVIHRYFGIHFPETSIKTNTSAIELIEDEEEEEHPFEYRKPKRSRKESWRYYNDNLDMDQQNIDFWNQF